MTGEGPSDAQRGTQGVSRAVLDDAGALLLRMRPWLWTVARSMLGEGEQRHVEDLVQEGGLALWKALRQGYRGDVEGFEPWCHVVAKNGMRNWTRDRLRAPTLGERNWDYVEDLAAVWEGVELAQELGVAYHHGQIHRALALLTTQQREYVVLRFWRGWSAGQLNARFATVNSGAIWQRAKPKLALALAHLAP